MLKYMEFKICFIILFAFLPLVNHFFLPYLCTLSTHTEKNSWSVLSTYDRHWDKWTFCITSSNSVNKSIRKDCYFLI